MTFQPIDFPAGEAAAFFQLGMLANELQRTAEAAPLVALCWLIDRSIGHGDADSDFKSLSALCRKLGYDQPALDSMIQRTEESYRKDRGRSLLLNLA